MDAFNCCTQIKDCFHKATKYLVSQLDSMAKGQLRSQIGDIENFQTVQIYLGDEEWQPKNLFIIYWNDNSPDWPNIKKLLTPDLTLAASECVGINGIKQATHPIEQGYYIGKDGWYENMIGQLKNLKSIIDESIYFLCKNFNQTFEVLEKYKTEILELQKRAQEINNNHEQMVEYFILHS